MGILWRFLGISYPASFTFDEFHFVENARNYLAGRVDWNDHPPLGKILMLPGLWLFGDNGLGWRVHESVFGVAHIALTGAVASALFRDRRAGWLAAAFVAIDGMFVSYSRTALLDIPMNAFMMASLALMLHARSLAWFVWAAVALGLGVAVKWIAVCVALVVPFLLLRQRRSVLHALWMGALAVGVYFGVVALALAITAQPVTITGMVTTSYKLIGHHAAFTDWKNPADSRWWTWFVLWKPIVLHRGELGAGQVRILSTVGNPLLWFATTAAFLVAMVALTRATWARVRHACALDGWTRALALILWTSFALILQWTITNRESYIWHYMGTYAMGLVLLAGLGARHLGGHPRLLGGLLLVAMAVSVFYAPVWTNAPLDVDQATWRLFMPRWR